MEKSCEKFAQWVDRWPEHRLGIDRVAVDSRQVNRQTLFFALPGEKTDGHNFLSDVKKKGGVAAVVSSQYRGPTYGLTLLPVADVQQALQQLAMSVHQRQHAPVVGVTGTVGKTTVKEFLSTILEERFSVAKTIGNANSQLGLPMTLINQHKQADILVLEMGMSFPGEISRLVAIAPPDIGVLTQISLVHAENFRSIDEVAAAKCELFTGNRLRSGFFCGSTLTFSAVQKLNCKKIIYNTVAANNVDYCFSSLSNCMTIDEKGKRSPVIDFPFCESHLLENALAAVAVARYFELSWEEIKRGVKKLTPYRHRFEKIEHRQVLYIDDSYNSSPRAVAVALRNLPKPKPGGKTVAILGAMKELGAFCEQSHREVGELAARTVDCLFCLGKECKPLISAFRSSGKPAELFEKLDQVTAALSQVVAEGDVVFIKGSCSLKMWKILDHLRAE